MISRKLIKGTTKKLPDETGAKVSYAMSLDKLARLAVYSKSAHSALTFASSISTVVEFQVRSDLIQSAIAIRRTADLINCNKELSKLKISEARRTFEKNKGLSFYNTRGHQSFSELLNKIVHHRELQLMDNELLETKSAPDLVEDMKRIARIQKLRQPVETLISIKSDKGGKLIFALTDFVEQALEFLEIAEEKLADKGIFVGSYQFS